MTLPIGRTNEEDLVSSEQVARVDLVGHVIETGIVAVGDDGYAQADVTCAGYGYLEVGEGSHRV